MFLRLAGNISNRLAHDIRRDSFNRLQELEFAFFDTRPVGWLISRLTSDCDRLARTIAWGALDLIWGFSFVLMIAISLLVLNWRLALIVLAVVPPLALVSRFFQKRLLFSARDIRKHNSQITARYNESIQGVRTTKTLVREAENLSEFKILSDQMYSAAVLNARQNAIYFPIIVSLGSLAAGLALWRGGWMASHDMMTVGTLVAFVNFAPFSNVSIHPLPTIQPVRPMDTRPKSRPSNFGTCRSPTATAPKCSAISISRWPPVKPSLWSARPAGARARSFR